MVLQARSAAPTNTLRVRFATGKGGAVSVARAFEELSPFGEIARLEVPPGCPNVAVVSYYDLRSAARVEEALCGRCTPEPSYGERTVVLRGDVELMPWMLPEIATVSQDAKSGRYTLDFFDTRLAERAAAELTAAASSTARAPAAAAATASAATPRAAPPSPPPGLPVVAASLLPATGGRLLEAAQAASSGATAARRVSQPQEPALLAVGARPALATAAAGSVEGPRYRNDLRLSEVNWSDLLAGRDARTTLRLRCLPAQLCDEDAFKWALRRAGLEEAVDCFRIFPGQGKRPGSALVNVADSKGVAAVARFFHGRQWGKTMPVAVSFAAVQGVAEVQRAFPPKSLQGPSPPGGSAYMKSAEPWRVEPFAEPEPGVSEVSTEVGDDAESPAYTAHIAEAQRTSCRRHA